MNPQRPPADDRPERGRSPSTRSDDPLAIAHRLRNALTSIVGRAQLLSRRVRTTGDIQPRHVLAGLEDIERSAKGMVEAIERLEADDRPAAGDRATRRTRPSPAPYAPDGDGDGERGGE